MIPCYQCEGEKEIWESIPESKTGIIFIPCPRCSGSGVEPRILRCIQYGTSVDLPYSMPEANRICETCFLKNFNSSTHTPNKTTISVSISRNWKNKLLGFTLVLIFTLILMGVVSVFMFDQFGHPFSIWLVVTSFGSALSWSLITMFERIKSLSAEIEREEKSREAK